MKACLLGLSCVVAAVSGPAMSGQLQIIKREPPLGMLRSGESVLVDDGKCPHGQVKKVTAGVVYGGRNNVSAKGLPRERSCVPRP